MRSREKEIDLCLFTLKRQLPQLNLRRIPAIKFFRITHQTDKGYASLFVKPFSSRLLQISTRFNCRSAVSF